MKTKTLVPFLAITFGLSWGIAALLIFFTDQMVAIFGEITNRNPLYVLMAYSPGIAGTFLVWRHYRLKGLARFFRRLTLWRMPRVWWLYLIVGIPIIAYLAAALNGTISDPFPFSPWYQVFPALVQGFFLLGTIEEFGWRGIAQPLLQRKMAPFWAGLIVGIIWATWHLPVFLFGGGVHREAEDLHAVLLELWVERRKLGCGPLAVRAVGRKEHDDDWAALVIRERDLLAVVGGEGELVRGARRRAGGGQSGHP